MSVHTGSLCTDVYFIFAGFVRYILPERTSENKGSNQIQELSYLNQTSCEKKPVPRISDSGPRYFLTHAEK